MEGRKEIMSMIGETLLNGIVERISVTEYEDNDYASLYVITKQGRYFANDIMINFVKSSGDDDIQITIYRSEAGNFDNITAEEFERKFLFYDDIIFNYHYKSIFEICNFIRFFISGFYTT